MRFLLSVALILTLTFAPIAHAGTVYYFGGVLASTISHVTGIPVATIAYVTEQAWPQAAAGGVPTIIDSQSATDNTGGISMTFTIPSGAVTGNEIVVFSAARNNSGTHSISVGSTLHQVNSTAGSQYSYAVHSYTVQASDTPGSTTFTVNFSTNWVTTSAIAITVSGTSGVDVSNAAADGSFNSTVTSPSVTTTGDDALILMGFAQPTSNSYSSGTHTEVIEATSNAAGQAVYESEHLTAGSTGSYSVTASGSNYGYGATVALLP